MRTARWSIGSRFALAALCAAWIVAPPAAADAQGRPEQFIVTQLADPLDGHQFEWSIVGAANGVGGFDSDGCQYSSGPQPRTYGVATSPTTLFSRPIEKWDQPIPEDKKDGLKAMLLSLGQDIDDARRLRAWQRYEIAAMVEEYLGGEPYDVGEMYLLAAWTVRDNIVGVLPGVMGSADAWKKLTEELLPMVPGIDSDRGRTIAAFDLARLSHRGGFVHERDAFLAVVDDLPDGGLDADAKKLEFLRRVAEEGRLLAKARDAFTVGLKEGHGTKADRAYYRYLVGDISRRLGAFEDAETQLEAVALDPAASEEVRAHVQDIKAALKVQGRTSAAVRAPLSGGESAP